MASRPETLVKMDQAQKLFSRGMSIREIASALRLSVARVRELLKGGNGDCRWKRNIPLQ